MREPMNRKNANALIESFVYKLSKGIEKSKMIRSMIDL